MSLHSLSEQTRTKRHYHRLSTSRVPSDLLLFHLGEGYKDQAVVAFCFFTHVCSQKHNLIHLRPETIHTSNGCKNLDPDCGKIERRQLFHFPVGQNKHICRWNASRDSCSVLSGPPFSTWPFSSRRNIISGELYFCEVRIFTRLPGRPLWPSAPCSINVPVVLSLRGKKIIKWRLSQTSYQTEGARAFGWWAIDSLMAQCTAAHPQHKRRSRVAEMIHFHRPLKAEGAQHLWPPQKQVPKMDSSNSPTLEDFLFQFWVYSPGWHLKPPGLKAAIVRWAM